MKEILAIFALIGLLIGLAIDLQKPDGSECVKIVAKFDFSSKLWGDSIVGCTVSVGEAIIVLSVIGIAIAAIIAALGNTLG